MLLILCVFPYILEVFLLYIRRGNNRGVVRRGIIKDYEVVVEFSLVINDIRLKVKVGVRGGGDVVSSTINLVAMPLDVVDKAI
jgi:hypothetical protein